MRNPDRHEQPAEGGRDIIERALQKQKEAKDGKKAGREAGDKDITRKKPEKER
jgi:hypothetical protein